MVWYVPGWNDSGMASQHVVLNGHRRMDIALWDMLIPSNHWKGSGSSTAEEACIEHLR